jgi:hypothetical protein
MCKWVMLPDRENPGELCCPEEGTPFCVEHDAELHGCASEKRRDACKSG